MFHHAYQDASILSQRISYHSLFIGSHSGPPVTGNREIIPWTRTFFFAPVLPTNASGLPPDVWRNSAESWIFWLLLVFSVVDFYFWLEYSCGLYTATLVSIGSKSMFGSRDNMIRIWGEWGFEAAPNSRFYFWSGPYRLPTRAWSGTTTSRHRMTCYVEQRIEIFKALYHPTRWVTSSYNFSCHMKTMYTCLIILKLLSQSHATVVMHNPLKSLNSSYFTFLLLLLLLLFVLYLFIFIFLFFVLHYKSSRHPGILKNP